MKRRGAKHRGKSAEPVFSFFRSLRYDGNIKIKFKNSDEKMYQKVKIMTGKLSTGLKV